MNLSNVYYDVLISKEFHDYRQSGIHSLTVGFANR